MATIQIRNVSDRLHRELRRRAKQRGQTLSDYVADILEREVAKPAPEEVFAQVRSRESVNLTLGIADVIREERRRREER